MLDVVIPVFNEERDLANSVDQLHRFLAAEVRGRTGAGRHQLHGLVVFAFGLAITSGSLFALHRR